MFTVKCFQFCPVFENCQNKILEVKEALQVKHEYGFGIKFALNVNVHESLNLVNLCYSIHYSLFFLGKS